VTSGGVGHVPGCTVDAGATGKTVETSAEPSGRKNLDIILCREGCFGPHEGPMNDWVSGGEEDKSCVVGNKLAETGVES
jgi:hypothetical protein